MSDISYTNIEVTYSGGKMVVIKDKLQPATAPLSDKYEDKTAPNNPRLEIHIAKVFHKALNLLKTDTGLFEKPDYELLGEMLELILFGKRDDAGDSRVIAIFYAEQMLDFTKNTCRIFLNFNQPSLIAVLPWEYTLYQSRGILNPGKSWYLSANTDMPFQLVRRVTSNVTPNAVAERLFIIVIMNVLGNENATPAIHARINEVKQLKQNFDSFDGEDQADGYPHTVEFLVNNTMNDTRKRIKELYREWQQEYGTDPTYVLHYIGHATMQNEKGQLVVIDDKDGKANWMEDKIFASYFESDSLRVAPPSLVCLQACDSGKIGIYQDELRGVAYEFAKLDIAAVVGMQNEINISESAAFFNTFYSKLLCGKDVAEATTAGRDFLGRRMNRPPSYQTNAFGSPVLFITTEEPVTLLKPKHPAAPAATISPDSVPYMYQKEPSQKVTDSRIRVEAQVSVATDAGAAMAIISPAQSISQGASASTADKSNRGDAAGSNASLR